MSNLSVFAGEYDGTAIRVTEDGRFSVYDVLAAFRVTDKAHAAETLNRIAGRYPEVHGFCVNFKFPGRGQRETPVTSEEGMYQILMLCPGKRGAEFRKFAAQVLRERREEETNPELAYARGKQRAINTWRKQGKTDREIATRIKGIETRNYFTETLKAHGVAEGWQYGAITNAIYLEMFSATAPELKQSRGLAKGDSLRDSMSLVENHALGLIEALSGQTIEDENRQGFTRCKDATEAAARKVKRVFES